VLTRYQRRKRVDGGVLVPAVTCLAGFLPSVSNALNRVGSRCWLTQRHAAPIHETSALFSQRYRSHVMPVYVGFVRAINVAGHAKVRMTVLSQAFVSAGCKDVRTLIQSGNVVFDTGRRKEASAFRAIRTELHALVGAEAVVVFRPVRHIRDLVAAAPFGEATNDRNLKLYVAFLAEEPRIAPAFPLVSTKERLEAIGMRAQEVFIVSRRKPNGMYGFPNNFIEDALQVPATTRNWSTVTKIATLSD
jgi:uncharacterized protein (DUF1697 family)